MRSPGQYFTVPNCSGTTLQCHNDWYSRPSGGWHTDRSTLNCQNIKPATTWYHIRAEKRTCAGQHRQNLLNKCPNMKKEHLSSLGPFFFLFLLPFFTCTVQPTCSRIKCMVLISCVHGNCSHTLCAGAVTEKLKFYARIESKKRENRRNFTSWPPGVTICI